MEFVELHAKAQAKGYRIHCPGPGTLSIRIASAIYEPVLENSGLLYIAITLLILEYLLVSAHHIASYYVLLNFQHAGVLQAPRRAAGGTGARRRRPSPKRWQGHLATSLRFCGIRVVQIPGLGCRVQGLGVKSWRLNRTVGLYHIESEFFFRPVYVQNITIRTLDTALVAEIVGHPPKA